MYTCTLYSVHCAQNNLNLRVNLHIKTRPVTRLEQMQRYMSDFCLHLEIQYSNASVLDRFVCDDYFA